MVIKGQSRKVSSVDPQYMKMLEENAFLFSHSFKLEDGRLLEFNNDGYRVYPFINRDGVPSPDLTVDLNEENNWTLPPRKVVVAKIVRETSSGYLGGHYANAHVCTAPPPPMKNSIFAWNDTQTGCFTGCRPTTANLVLVEDEEEVV